MGYCRYCGKPAGFFKYVHEECKDRHDVCIIKFKQAIDDCFNNKINFTDYDDKFRQIAQNGVISQQEVEKLFQNSFDEFAEKIISRGNITNDELEQIARFKDITEWSEDRIDCHGFFSKIIYNYVKQSIREGHIPTFHSIPKTECPFVLNNNEVIIWIFNNVDFYQKKLHKSYSGRSNGVNIRIAKGVYYRTGGHKGNIESNYSLDYIDSGSLYLTTNGLYYKGSDKYISIPFKKLMTFESDNNCVIVSLKSSSSNTMKFKHVDPALINDTLTMSMKI